MTRRTEVSLPTGLSTTHAQEAPFQRQRSVEDPEVRLSAWPYPSKRRMSTGASDRGQDPVETGPCQRTLNQAIRKRLSPQRRPDQKQPEDSVLSALSTTSASEEKKNHGDITSSKFHLLWDQALGFNLVFRKMGGKLLQTYRENGNLAVMIV